MKCLILFQIFVVAVIGSEAELQDFAKANNLFTASLYNEIVKNKEPNFLISPYSLETVLAFAHSGSKGETAQEIRRALHLPDDKKQIESAVEESLSILKANCQYTLHIANKMYVQDDFPINDSFTRDAVEIFHAGIENVDFNKSTEAAGKINEWVEKQTKNKIKNVMDPAILDEYTRAVLVNAIYFKGNWSNPFSEFRTIKKRFFKTKNDFIEVDTMHRYSGKFNFYESPELDAKFLEMPYKGDGLSMTIVLPNDIEGLASLERQIGKVFEPQNLEIEEVNVALPKFKIENTLELTSVLKALGIEKAFNRTEADLTRIGGEKKGDLFVGDVVQKGYINVEEKGAEAAVATVLRSTTFGKSRPKRLYMFIADHPFIFYIKVKNFIIFAGRVSSPHY